MSKVNEILDLYYCQIGNMRDEVLMNQEIRNLWHSLNPSEQSVVLEALNGRCRINTQCSCDNLCEQDCYGDVCRCTHHLELRGD